MQYLHQNKKPNNIEHNITINENKPNKEAYNILIQNGKNKQYPVQYID